MSKSRHFDLSLFKNLHSGPYRWIFTILTVLSLGLTIGALIDPLIASLTAEVFPIYINKLGAIIVLAVSTLVYALMALLNWKNHIK